MSDLIDFDSPVTNNNLLLASPLIPPPSENSKNNGSNLSEAGPHVSEYDKRRSMENNPFDLVMKKITDYERNKEDPFEKVFQKAIGFSGKVSIESKDDFILKCTKYSDVLKMNKSLNETETNLVLPRRKDKNELVEEENDMSIITDLNNTNLIDDNNDVKQVITLWNCDNKPFSNIIISPPVCNKDLSILNTSAMNDSLLDHNENSTENVEDPFTDFKTRQRSMSQSNLLFPKKLSPQILNRRSLSVNDTMKNNNMDENNTVSSVRSNIFEDPMNNAFRKTICSSNSSSINSTSSYINMFDLSTNKQNLERLNSDSSVFSGLSNISTISMDPLNNVRQIRFCSENSAFASTSNLSIIPTNNTISSCESSVFSNDSLNKAFINSRSQLSSTSSTVKSPLKSSDNSDLIKKFYQIKTRMSINEIEYSKSDEKKEPVEEKSNFMKENKQAQKENNILISDEKLIDVSNNANKKTSVNDVILHEARALAEVFEKMALSKDSSSSTEDDLLFSKTQMNFDNLPPSDDEAINDLIELPSTPIRNAVSPNVEAVTKTQSEINLVPTKNNIKDLENEFIKQDDSNKKATTATLLLELEKLIKEENNPSACLVLNDLQKLLGVECANNTDILQVCLQGTNSSVQSTVKSEGIKDSDKNVPENEQESNDLIDVQINCENNLSKVVLDNEQKVLNNGNCESNINNLNEKLSKNVKTDNECKNDKQLENNRISCESEDRELAINLLNTLNKIVNQKSKDSSVDILRALGTVLNMATELRTKNKDKHHPEIKVNKKNFSNKHLNRSINSTSKLTPKKNNTKIQNKSFEVLPIRRSLSINPITNSNSLDLPSAKDKKKSHLLNIKKRFPSDPGSIDSTSDKQKSENLDKVEQKSNLGTGKSTLEPVKTKFKKKSNSDIVTKKGPLKAVIPLGNMQKRASINQRMSIHNGNASPKPLNSAPAKNIISSTPNSSEESKNSKSKPMASSTPNIIGLKSQRVKVQTQSNSNCVSPVSLNSSLKGNANASKISVKRMERTLSPQIRPRKNSESGNDSRLPRYSPRPVRIRNYSLNDLKTIKSPQTTKVLQISSEKKTQRRSVLSPLKNGNTLAGKTRSMNLVSKLGKSNSIQVGPEKENY